MSRFLANLLARSLAPVPAIQPRLASRYEPAAGAGSRSGPDHRPALPEIHEDARATIPATRPAAPPTLPIPSPSIAPAPTPHLASTAQPSLDHTPDFRPHRRPASTNILLEYPPEQVATRIQPPATHLPKTFSSPLPPSRSGTASGLFFAPSHGVADTSIRPSPASPQHPQSPVPPSPASAASTASQPALLTPPVASTVPASTPSVPPASASNSLVATPPPTHSPASSEPGVRISIGRVEIRATPPPAAAPALRTVTPPATTTPTLPLNEYLRRRDTAA